MMSSVLYKKLDDTGNVIACEDMQDWMNWMKANSIKKSIGKTPIGEYFVSTEFIGTIACLFETTIYDHRNGDRNPLVVYKETYNTLEAATKGHENALGIAKGMLN